MRWPQSVDFDWKENGWVKGLKGGWDNIIIMHDIHLDTREIRNSKWFHDGL